MEFQVTGCDPDPDTGVNTKVLELFFIVRATKLTRFQACHCSEGGWVRGNKNSNNEDEPIKSLIDLVIPAYLNFFRTNTFPPNTIKSWREMNFDGFNIIANTGITYAQPRAEECNTLDFADNYFWKTADFAEF